MSAVSFAFAVFAISIVIAHSIGGRGSLWQPRGARRLVFRSRRRGFRRIPPGDDFFRRPMALGMTARSSRRRAVQIGVDQPPEHLPRRPAFWKILERGERRRPFLSTDAPRSAPSMRRLWTGPRRALTPEPLLCSPPSMVRVSASRVELADLM